MIQIDNLSMRFGSKILFDAVSMNLNNGCRYGITGANGSGKSTLLGIFSGEVSDFEGKVRLPGALKVGFLKQDHFEYENDRIVDAVIMGRPRLWDAIKEKAKLHDEDKHDAESGMRLAELESIICEENGYSAESEAAIILEGLGIESAKHENLMGTLSGGYKLRVLLAQCLFGAPGLLLLDEPTNHLDIMSIAWLEKYLTNYEGIVVAVSHDHHFLNSVVTHIMDIDYEDIRLYHGNYDFSLEAKGLNKLQQDQLIARQEKKKGELEAFYKRFRAQATKARQAMSRKKQLDKMDDIKIKRSSRIAPRFRFKLERQPGKEVFDIKNLSKSFEGNPVEVISNLSLNIMRGERVAIIGPNGAGKTTLMTV
ncbi:MAG: ABC-F family ATP-binding cassette domain-containing protein, partial [Proteobacteria bacterium]|nr:ABC-F family ATP-binding cassette domain-containing protein [Pseudomonadota bacterium]